MRILIVANNNDAYFFDPIKIAMRRDYPEYEIEWDHEVAGKMLDHCGPEDQLNSDLESYDLVIVWSFNGDSWRNQLLSADRPTLYYCSFGIPNWLEALTLGERLLNISSPKTVCKQILGLLPID